MITLHRSLRTKGAASTAPIETSVFGLDGCAVVKGVFNVAVGVGVVIVVTIVALGDGIAALVTRNG